jgi:putative heme-binding domain-containing protein
MPEGWPAVYASLARSPNAEVREIALTLAVIFGDSRALAALQRIVNDRTADPGERERALQALIQKKEPQLAAVLQKSLDDKVLRGTAVRGLAAYAAPETPALILRNYAAFAESERRDAISTLSSRPAYALALLEAIEQERIPRRDLTAFTVRQLAGLKDAAVDEKIRAVWGEIRPPAQEKAEFIAKYKALLTPEALKKADRAHGRVVFVKTCAACHRLFDDGGKIGPELTGAQRGNLDYVLENLLDPSAVVPRDYQMTILETTEGRVITGIVKQESEATLTMQTPNESLIIPKGEIEDRIRSPLSMMPEGLLTELPQQDVRDLVAYLASPEQVLLPASAGTPENGTKSERP